jgi:tetratricopeptide (TPR) repeat protein
MALVNAATVHLLGGDLEKARERFEAALAVDADVARAWNGLGVIAASQNRAEEAIGRWKEAVRLDPGDHQALFNLGLTLRRLGRADEARPYFEAYLRTAPSRSEARDLARVRAWLAPHEGRR